MRSEKEVKQSDDLEARLQRLEENSHPPVEWEKKIERIRQELDLLYKKLARYGI